jgi:hypothetical protein
MPVPDSQTLQFRFIERINGPGFTQDVYSREGRSLSFTRTDFAATEIELMFEQDIAGVITHLNLPSEPTITVAREPQLQSLSTSFLRMGFISYSQGGAVSRLEITGIATMEGKVVKLRYTDSTPTDTRQSSADAMLFFKHLLNLAPRAH